MPAELAWRENNDLGYVDWDAGGDKALESYDRLSLRVGLAKFTDAEREQAARICAHCKKRGDPLPRLFDHLAATARTRARRIVGFNMGQATDSLRY